MKLAGLTVAFGAIVAAMAMGSDLATFINLPSVLFVFGVGFGCLVFGHGIAGLGLAFRAAFSTVEQGEGAQAAEAAQTAAKTFAHAGWLGVIVGLVQMLANLDDPAAIGPAVAVALLTALYGHGMAALIWIPTERRMRASLLR